MKVNINFMDTATFAARLKSAMEMRGLTCEELAEQVDTHATTIQNWRRGKTLPTLDMACGLADAMKVSLDWLTGRKEQNND